MSKSNRVNPFFNLMADGGDPQEIGGLLASLHPEPRRVSVTLDETVGFIEPGMLLAYNTSTKRYEEFDSTNLDGNGLADSSGVAVYAGGLSQGDATPGSGILADGHTLVEVITEGCFKASKIKGDLAGLDKSACQNLTFRDDV